MNANCYYHLLNSCSSVFYTYFVLFMERLPCKQHMDSGLLVHSAKCVPTSSLGTKRAHEHLWGDCSAYTILCLTVIRSLDAKYPLLAIVDANPRCNQQRRPYYFLSFSPFRLFFATLADLPGVAQDNSSAAALLCPAMPPQERV